MILTLLIKLVNVIFVTLKLIYVSGVFFLSGFKYVTRIALPPTEILKCNFSKFNFLSRYQYALNMAEALNFILKIE